MKKILFHPQKLELPKYLVLIPQFRDNNYYESLKKKAYGCLKLIESDFLFFDNYTLIVGFLGYPHILTLLEFVEDVREKEVFFLGTAGSLNENIDKPTILDVVEIHSTEILDYFSSEHSFQLNSFNRGQFKKARGVTVDIIQRETSSWLKEQVSRGMDFVEMELFPLRVYLEKPFHAIVVTTDLLKETGIEVFPDKKLVEKEFVKSYEFIVAFLTETANR